MQSDNLTISVLFGTGVKQPEIQKVLESLPQLKLLEQTCDPQGYVSLHKGNWPDLVLVTPHLAKPLTPGTARMPDEKWVRPNDYETYLLGLDQGRPKNDAPAKVQAPAQNLPSGFGPQKLD